MGLDVLVYVGYIIMAAGFVYGLYMMNKAGGDMENLDPSTLDDFNITKADEGSVVPLVYGRRKVTGNIIWYGNLHTEPIWEKVDAGKDDEWVITGYNYYLDVWQSLGHGDMSIIETYINADLKNVEYSSIVFNNGSNGSYSTIPGEYATQLNGVCHVFYRRMLLGENVQTVPTVHYVVERLMGADVPVDYKNMSNGINPAAIVYDLLRRGGASSGDIDLTSFNAAADYWNTKGYGLNVVFTNKPKTREAIRQVLQYVGAAFGQDDQGRFYLNPLDENDTSVATISYDDGDFNTFSFERQTWDKLHTDFIATYIDQNKEYTERTVKAYNPAVARILGRRIENSIKLQGFRDLDTASKRIWEVMKEGTYPFANVQTDVPMRFYALKLGDVITLNNSKYGISNAAFRVMKKTIKGQKDNSFSITLRQKTEELYDSNWTTVGGSQWTVPDYTPSAAFATKLWQLPYNHLTGSETSYLCLVARTNTFETGYALYKSYDNSEFSPASIKTRFAQYGTLDSDYPITIEIDETVGLTYTPYQEDPSFDTISLESAIQMPRAALIGDELIGFATVTLNGDGSITLTDCIRGMMGTIIAAHSTSDPIWIFPVDIGIVYKTEDSEFYYKVAPYSLGGSVDISGVSSTLVTKDDTGSLPPGPAFYYENNAGDRTVTVYPHFFDFSGAGMTGEQADSINAITVGRIGYEINSEGANYTTDNPFTFTRAGDHTLYVWYEFQGKATARTSMTTNFVTLPAFAGLTIPDTNSGLVKLRYGQQAFMDIADYNANIVETTLVYISGLLDTDTTGVADEDYLVFDAAQQKFIPVGYSSFIEYGGGLDALPLLEGEHGPYEDGSITASGYYSQYVPQHAWDGGDGSYYPQWICEYSGPFDGGSGLYWYQWNWTDHGGSRDIRGIRLYTRYNATTDCWPSSVDVYGSDTGSFSGEEKLLYSGPLEDAENIGPNQWTTWTAFDQEANFASYVYLRAYITGIYVYDSGSYWFAVDQWQLKEALSWEYPTAFEIVYGYTYQKIDQIYYDDADEMTITGIDRTIPLEVNFHFGAVEETSVYFNVIGRYEGVDGHNVKVYAYDWTSGVWDALTLDTTDMPNSTSEDLHYWQFSTIDYVNVSDEMKIKLRVESAGDENDTFVLDKVGLSSSVHPYYDGQGWDSDWVYHAGSVQEYDKLYVSLNTSNAWRPVLGLDVINGNDKIYFEVEVEEDSASAGYLLVGIGRYAHTNTYYLGSDRYSFSYRSNGNSYTNGSATVLGSTWTTGDIIGVAVDYANNKIWFAKNNTWQGSGDPANGTNPAYEDVDLSANDMYPGGTTYFPNEKNKLRIHLKAADQTYTAPTGFTSLGDKSSGSTTTTTT